MKPRISFTKIWADDDLSEIRIQTSDGHSLFSNDVYVGHYQLSELVKALDGFKLQIRSGIYDIQFGAFGSEYAHGAFHARMHFQDRGILFITVRSQSSFKEFGQKEVASEATLYLRSEPALLDNFIEDLKRMREGKQNQAQLDALV